MRRAFLLCLLLPAGCRGKGDADNAPEFVEKFSAACREKDLETVWKMFSQDTQNTFTEAAKSILETAKNNPAIVKRLKLDYDLTQEPDTLDPVVFAKIRLKKDHKKNLEAWASAKFNSELKDGNDTSATVECSDGREDWLLVREKSYLRFEFTRSRVRSR